MKNALYSIALATLISQGCSQEITPRKYSNVKSNKAVQDRNAVADPNSDETSEGSSDPNTGTSLTDLSGKFQSACRDISASPEFTMSFIMISEFEADKLTMVGQRFEGNDCTGEKLWETRSTGDVEINTSDVDGQFNVDSKLGQTWITAYTPQEVEMLKAEGYTNAEINVPQEEMAGEMKGTVYSIATLSDEGVCFGTDSGGNDGSSADKRHTDVDVSTCMMKVE